ncbi:cyclase family protein [Methanolacinia petrolearia]|uniref:cyclase family protein n=1 Tax=Methanolacinia petrolearia TaxID=54120 RepID=UPI003BA9F1C9
MDYIDITIPLSEKTPVFPGDPEVRFNPLVRDGFRLTSIELSSHSGTHVDAPLHYIEGGLSVDRIPLGRINGESIVVDLRGAGHSSGFITRGDIPEKINGAKILILNTGFSPESSGMDRYMSINIECAGYLADCGYTCVVTDAPSIESFDGDGTVHRILLGRDVYIIEMADLSHVSPGRYHLYAIPLKLEGCDGSPVRAVLVPCSKEV